MGANSKIEWTHHTFNPWIGCTKVSDACKHCYAEVETFPRVQRAKGRELWGANADRHITDDRYWKQPLKWNQDAAQRSCNYCEFDEAEGYLIAQCENCKQRPRVFCASLADVFEDHASLIDPRHRLMQLIEQTPNLDWLLLTKRPENIGDMVPVKWFGDGFPSNIWIGTTVEDQAMADLRIPKLWKIPAKVRFLSCEPLLGPVNLGLSLGFIDWVIAGGESGPNARPMNPEWARSLRDQCQAAGVPFFFKQSGEWIGGKFDRRKSKMVCDATEAGKSCGQIFWTNPGAPKVHLWDEADHYWTNASARVGKKATGRTLDGREWNEIPIITNQEAQ